MGEITRSLFFQETVYLTAGWMWTPCSTACSFIGWLNETVITWFGLTECWAVSFENAVTVCSPVFVETKVSTVAVINAAPTTAPPQAKPAGPRRHQRRTPRAPLPREASATSCARSRF